MDGLEKLAKPKASREAITEAVERAMEGDYIIAVQRIDDDGVIHQSVFRHWPANRLGESADEFERAQLNESRRVDARRHIREYLVELGLIEE